MKEQLEEGEIVLCTVDRIIGTNVFVHIEDDGEGSIIFSEVAPGRIRNIRDYAVPRKKIVCKVLRVKKGNIELSLRRVTQKERKEKLEEAKQEKSYASILKTILKDEADGVIKKISEKQRIYDFFQEAKETPKKLEKLVGKKDAKKILDILKKEKKKKVIVKKNIFLTTKKPDGLGLIKEVLSVSKNIEIKYISAGNYMLKTESDDPKKADNELQNHILEIEKQAKNKGMEFSIKEK